MSHQSPLVVGLVTGYSLVASAALAASSPGLFAQYTDGVHQISTVVPTANFSLLPAESIDPRIKPAFGAAWTGALRILEAGKFRFAAGPATLFLDGKPVPAGSSNAFVDLKAGEHPLRIEFRRSTPAVQLQILWESETFGPEPIPPSVLVHDAALDGRIAVTAAIDRGRQLANELNCRGCHGPALEARATHGRGPILTHVGVRLTPAWIARWLENPASYQPHATMPSITLSEGERRDVTAFLLTLTGQGTVDAAGFASGDDSATPQKISEGKDLFEKIGCLACHGPTATVASLTGVGSKMSASVLAAYLMNPGKVEPTGRMPSLLLKGRESSAIAAYLVQSRNPGFEGAVPQGDAVKGKSLVAGRGCLGCHAIDLEGKALVSTLSAPDFAKLRAGRGCLAAAPPARAPRYRLTAAERGDLGAYLAAPDLAVAPTTEFWAGIKTFHCQQCHELGRAPAVTFKESPPSLNDTGNKLRQSWVAEVLGDKMRTRPWLELRMPHFPQGAYLASRFAAVAGASRQDPPPPPKPEGQALREGVRYLGRGEEGLSCITCHDFAWFKSGSATPAPDMSTMGRRMRPDWFRRWMMDPGRIAPGTQMPAFFVDVDKGVADRKIGGMWGALSLGRDMPLPEGVTPDNRAVKLVVGKEPVVFRSFVTGGGMRSILVGFPGGQSYAFDADECRLEFAWQGEFLDVRPVWYERGGDKAQPLGHRYFLASNELPVRVGQPRPPSKPHWKGYSLSKGVPTMIYEVDGAEVNETITPLANGLSRSFVMRGIKAGTDVWFVPGALAGVDLQVKGGTWDGQGQLRVPSHGGTAHFTVTMTASVSTAKR